MEEDPYIALTRPARSSFVDCGWTIEILLLSLSRIDPVRTEYLDDGFSQMKLSDVRHDVGSVVCTAQRSDESGQADRLEDLSRSSSVHTFYPLFPYRIVIMPAILSELQ